MFGSLALAIVWMSPLLVGPDVALRWSQSAGASTCIGDRELAAAVTARLGGANTHGRARIVISGDIAPAATGWTAAIRTEDDHGVVLGQRDLHEAASDCRTIDDKLVLVIALIIDPDLLDETPTRPAPLSPVSAPHEPWQFGASVAALVSRGMLPGFGFGTAVVAMIEPPHVWPIEIGATLWPHDRAIADPGGATLLQLTGGVAVCPHLVGPLSACAGVEAGELRAQGFGYSRNELQHELLVDGTLELRLDWRFGRDTGARFGAGAWIPASRPRFAFRDGTTDVMVYQPAVAAGVTELALWTRF